MARLALRLQVFISSPADVQKERDLVEGVVWRLARQAARHDLALSVYRFEEDAIPAYGRPLDQSNVDLKASELVIAILGQGIGTPSRVGSTETGTLEELRADRQEQTFVRIQVDRVSMRNVEEQRVEAFEVVEKPP